MTQPDLAEMCYESAMWKLYLLGLITDKRIQELNEKSWQSFEGCSDE